MQFVLHADETTLQVLHEEGKKAQTKSYMWLYRTSGDAETPIVLYEYQPSRKGAHAEEFLKGFAGYLHADGYQGYRKLRSNIRVVGCWAHARRKFDEALKTIPPHKREGSAIIYSLVETAKENGLDPYHFLVSVFERAPGLELNEHPERVHLLLPLKK